MTMSKNAPEEAGFTIIELLIAMTVVSVILLLSTIMITNIGSLYYKGISQSRAQDNVRAITDEIAQKLELTQSTPVPSGAAPPSATSICIGNTRYTYILGRQINATPGLYQLRHVLWRDEGGSGCPPGIVNLSAVTPSPNGTELIAPRSRLTGFSITSIPGSSNVYAVTVKTAFGETDQLCDKGTPNNCNSPVQSNNVWSPSLPAPGNKILCKGSRAVSGQQFCGVAGLTTTVVQRLK